MKTQKFLLIGALCAIAVASISPIFANFAGTELILPAAGRVIGAGGTEFLTTGWVTNPTDHAVDVQFQFLQSGQSNLSPLTVTDTLGAGQTKTYENLAETLFGLNGVLGAVRVRASSPIFVSARIFSQAPGASLANTNGVYFAGVPSTFAIGQGEQGSLQGVNQNGDFRYNFFMVEVSGAPASVHIRLRNGAGDEIATRTYTLQPYEQLLVSVNDLAPGRTVNGGQIQATVTSDNGRVIFAGSLVANGSQDSTGFEMSFKSELLASNAIVVRTLNGLNGDLSLIAGNNVSIVPSGNSLRIDADAGLNGAAGPAGPQGPQGPAGSAGVAGPIGPTGLSGANGSTGAPGAAGITGSTGPQGLIGPTGVTGAIGPTGLTGPSGDPGSPGAPGVTGATGSVGPQGPIGPTGLTGPSGNPGSPGAPGATGAAGSVGPQGPIGLTGASGAIGPTGAPGASGNPGTPGASGATGATGATGPTGPPGSTGATGASGNTGLAGINGAQGFTGPIGPTGATGPTNLIVPCSAVQAFFGRAITTGSSSGGGFTSVGTATSITITFSPAFASAPTLTGTAEGPDIVSISSISGSSATLILTGAAAPIIFSRTGSGLVAGNDVRAYVSSPAVHFQVMGCIGPIGVTGPTGITGATGPTGPT